MSGKGNKILKGKSWGPGLHLRLWLDSNILMSCIIYLLWCVSQLSICPDKAVIGILAMEECVSAIGANVQYSAKVFGSHSHEGTDREVKICAMVYNAGRIASNRLPYPHGAQ